MHRGADHVVERTRELAALDTAQVRACGGDGALVAVRGEPGIGKSRLCMETVLRAQARGLRVLTARGGELEHDLVYGVARQLLERTVHGLAAEGSQTIAAGPAQLAAQLIARSGPAAPLAESGIDHSLYWLVANLCEAGPVAIVVDDAQWADLASLRFLVYLCRRLEGLPLLIVVAARDGEPSEVGGLLALIADAPGCIRIHPSPLSLEGTRQVLTARLVRDVSARLTRACHHASGGNPLLLGEIARGLAEGGAPEMVDPSRLALALPPSVAQAILMRLGRLPAEAHRVAQALAVAGDGAPVGLLAEIAALEHDQVTSALDRLARAGISTGGSELAFAHPIVRSAVYGDQPTWRRTELHARAARALIDRRAAADQIAHHLLLAEPTGDPQTVRRLRDAARDAAASGAPAECVRILARALEEPPPDEDRPDVLVELAEAELRTGAAADAAAHATEALTLALRVDVRVRAAVAAGTARLATGDAEGAFSLLDAGARSLDGDAALRLDAERAALANWVRGSLPMPWLGGLLERFGSLDGVTVTERLALTQAAIAVAYDPCGTASVAATLARRALADGALVAELTVDAVPVGMAAYVLVMAGDFAAADREIALMLDSARTIGSVIGQAGTRQLAGQVALVRGRLADATAEWETSLAATRDLAPAPVVDRCAAFAVAMLVESLLAAGERETAQAVVDRAAAAGDFDRPERVWARYGRGLIALDVLDDARAAVDDLLAFGEAARAGGYEDRWTRWRQWAALALARAGRGAEAIALADEQLCVAEAWSPGAQGAALRIRALVGDPADAEARLARSSELLGDSEFLLDRALTVVDHGRALRRAGRRTDARDQLRVGLDLADRCGARPLVAIAREELAVLGERPRRLRIAGVESLTAAERRVAAMAADGRSNREIAETLFVSAKTVETHLRAVFRKLDVGSRTELPGVLAGESPAAAPSRGG